MLVSPVMHGVIELICNQFYYKRIKHKAIDYKYEVI